MAVIDTLTNLATSFSSSAQHDRPRDFNRYSGGHHRTSQPYISGYWYLIMQPPVALFGNPDAAHEASKWFHSTAESFTPPSKTITKVDVPGMGGMASSFAAGQELSRTFTVAFREHQDLPIMKALTMWTNVIDAKSGFSPIANFVPNEYKGMAIAALMRPSTVTGSNGDKPAADNIEQLFAFEGVFPETLPYDSFNSDIATNDSLQLSVTFSFDGWPLTKENPQALKYFLDQIGQLDGPDIMFKTHIDATLTGSDVADGKSFVQDKSTTLT